MKNRLMIICDEISDELAGINLLAQDLQNAAGQELETEIRNRVFASILSDFYMAVERIFKIVAKDIDMDLPEEEDWHKKLLRQAVIAIPGVRPPVVEKELYCRLEEYLKFRHLVRNIYGFQLKYERFAHLVEDLPEVANTIREQVSEFLAKMQEVADSLE